MPGVEASVAAAMEAWEEAGVKGHVHERPVGIFSYIKELDDRDDLPCVAITYAMQVRRTAGEYPEMDARERKWMSPRKASKLVSDPELAQMIAGFDPASLSD